MQEVLCEMQRTRITQAVVEGPTEIDAVAEGSSIGHNIVVESLADYRMPITEGASTVEGIVSEKWN